MVNDVEYVVEENKIIFTKLPEVLTRNIISKIISEQKDITSIELCEGVKIIDNKAFSRIKTLKNIHFL